MYTKVWGMIVSALGAMGLVASVILVNIDGSRHIDELFAGGILGAVAFFAGIWMIPTKGR